MGFYDKFTKNKTTALPIETRLKAYYETLRLKKETLSAVEIWRKLRSKGIDIKYETIRRWFTGFSNPYRKLNTIKKFDGDLVTIMGLIIGDGSFYKVIKNGLYTEGRVCFAVNDKDLAEEFAFLLSKVLGRKKLYSVRFDSKRNIYVIDKSSKHLVEFLLKPLNELKPVIEKYPQNFIMGLFDAEGSVVIRFTKNKRVYPRIFFTNSDMELIKYVKSLLEKFSIASTIQINTMAGKYKFIKGKYTATNKTCYNLCIENIEGARKFNSLVGFITKRKMDKLNKIVTLIEKYGTDGAFQRLKIND